MPITLTDAGYRPRFAAVNSERASHLAWHTGLTGTVQYRRTTPAEPRGDVQHDFETGSFQKAHARIAACSDDPGSPDPAKDHVIVAWVDTASPGKNRLVVEMSHDGGLHFARKPLTAPHVSITNPVLRALAGTSMWPSRATGLPARHLRGRSGWRRRATLGRAGG